MIGIKGFSKGYTPWNKGLPAEMQPSFGIVVGAETKKKISQSLMGRKNPKHSEFMKGRVASKETKQKIVIALTGRKCSEETRKKISESRMGSKHWNWNPNRELVKKNLRNDAVYQQWVNSVKRRDNNSCQLKNEECSGYNIVHHIKNWSQYPELRYKLNNGVTLCQAHHPLKRAEEKVLESTFQELVLVSNAKLCHI